MAEPRFSLWNKNIGKRHASTDHNPTFKYFKPDENDCCKMLCQILRETNEGEPGLICGAPIKVQAAGKKDIGAMTGNLRRHLLRYHKNEYDLVQKELDALSSSRLLAKKSKVQKIKDRLFITCVYYIYKLSRKLFLRHFFTLSRNFDKNTFCSSFLLLLIH